jgi:hypothetical protein
LPIAAAVPALLLGPLPARATILPEPPLAYRDTADNARALLIGLFTVGWQAESTATTTPDSR